MECLGRLEDISIDFKTNKPKITFILNNKEVLQNIEELKEAELQITASKKKNKRSLDANSYMWILCQRIAEKLNISKIEVYRDAIKQIGVFDYILIKNEAVETYIKNWNKNGIGWICEKLENSKIEGCTKLLIYYGSSTYNTYQMSKLVDLIVQLAKSIGIETKPEAELKSLKEK